MSNGDEMLDDLEFERQIGKLSDRGLQEFTARQVYETRKIVYSNTGRIDNLESNRRKTYAVTGGIGSMIGAAVVAVFNYFFNR